MTPRVSEALLDIAAQGKYLHLTLNLRGTLIARFRFYTLGEKKL